MKEAIKRWMDRYPRLLRGNPLAYAVARRRAYRGVRVRPELSGRRDLLDALDRDGVVVVPNYLSADAVAPMLTAAEALIARVADGQHRESVFTVQPDIVYRVARVENLAPETRSFFADPMIRGVFEALVAPGIASYRHELEYRFGEGQVAQADLFHFDNWRPICKAFLYLTDVGPDQAPFTYLTGSHRQDAWRTEYNVDYDVAQQGGRFGHFFPQEIRRLRKEHAWEERICTGPAGTLILADFRGLHRGTPLRSGRRILLNNTFDLMNPEVPL